MKTADNPCSEGEGGVLNARYVQVFFQIYVGEIFLRILGRERKTARHKSRARRFSPAVSPAVDKAPYGQDNRHSGHFGKTPYIQSFIVAQIIGSEFSHIDPLTVFI